MNNLETKINIWFDVITVNIETSLKNKATLSFVSILPDCNSAKTIFNTQFSI